MKSSAIRLLILFGAATIIGIIVFQMYWVKKTYDIHENQFNQNVHVALYDVASKLAEYNNSGLYSKSPVRQLSSNYFVVEVNDFINADVLDMVLIKKFNKHKINIDYEYAIYDCYEEKMVYGRYVSKDNKKRVEPSQHQFMTCRGCLYYFGIYFPNKSIHIVSNMDIWFISSFILVSAIVFFAYSLFVVFRQKRLSEIQRDFINNMTHEFKTPISTIAISSEVLSKKKVDPERFANYVAIIAEQNRRLKGHVERLLQVASVDKKRLLLNPTTINLNGLIKDIGESFKPIIDEKGGSLTTIITSEKIQVEADLFHLTNIIVNLIDNAIKYSKNIPEITLTLEQKNRYARFCVEDDGIGIEKKYHKRIFRRFFRVPTGLIHNVKGFGLGLHYVKNVVKAHRWKITLNSEPGKGSKFCIKIPDKYVNNGTT
ncbi:MAG: HAMP domain-containing sensor histidine kinase [Bacteroidales bacterium]|nr:HAMP domain-containing sensor histidine kinase [Bacteroidales bacterium]